MNIEPKLISRLRSGEDRLTEWKPDGVSDREIRQTLTAFANSISEGEVAVLFIGVADDGRIIGVSDTDKKQKQVRKCADQCYPPIKHNSLVLDVPEGRVLAIQVVSSDKPHFSGPAYVRVGSESVCASEAMFTELIASRSGIGQRILKERTKIGRVIWQTSPRFPSVAQGEPQIYERAYRVESCDPQFVSIKDETCGHEYRIPIEEVALEFDNEHRVFALIVKESYAARLQSMQSHFTRRGSSQYEEGRLRRMYSVSPRQAIRWAYEGYLLESVQNLCSAFDLQFSSDIVTYVSSLIGAGLLQFDEKDIIVEIYRVAELAQRSPNFNVPGEEVWRLCEIAMKLSRNFEEKAKQMRDAVYGPD